MPSNNLTCICHDCRMEFTRPTCQKALKLHKRDVHQAETRVVFADSVVEHVLHYDINGNFSCPLPGCLLVTAKPGTIQAHCKRKRFFGELHG